MPHGGGEGVQGRQARRRCLEAQRGPTAALAPDAGRDGGRTRSEAEGEDVLAEVHEADRGRGLVARGLPQNIEIGSTGAGVVPRLDRNCWLQSARWSWVDIP